MNNTAHDKYSKSIEKTDYIELDNLLENFIFMQEKVKDRETKILTEIEKNRKKDIQLFEQSKLASMGEMIGNIAHQWRQPLSIISTSATGIQMQKEYNILTDDKLDEACETINIQTQYLSKLASPIHPSSFFQSYHWYVCVCVCVCVCVGVCHMLLRTRDPSIPVLILPLAPH